MKFLSSTCWGWLLDGDNTYPGVSYPSPREHWSSSSWRKGVFVARMSCSSIFPWKPALDSLSQYTVENEIWGMCDSELRAHVAPGDWGAWKSPTVRMLFAQTCNGQWQISWCAWPRPRALKSSPPAPPAGLRYALQPMSHSLALLEVLCYLCNWTLLMSSAKGVE